MNVIFVSQCEKKALNRTRRVLDSFANRIGERTWQTMITEDGLIAVKTLLRKTVTKNTSVACHWIRSRSRSELVWIVGNRQKFNEQGIVPVNSTGVYIINTQWESDWHYLPLVKSLSALAGLFHDWGKASSFFQEKLKNGSLKGDPIRHEWISVLLLRILINEARDDSTWLQRLSRGAIDEKSLQDKLASMEKPMENLPDAAKLIAWLIVSHHRLPLIENEDWRGEKAGTLQEILTRITQQWGYTNNSYDTEKSCFDFSYGLPVQSKQWLEKVTKWTAKMQASLRLLDKAMKDGSWRLILYYARLSLMLGDHHYSSQDKDQNWQSKYDLIANTYNNSDKQHKRGAPKQKLDEHLVGVAQDALRIAALLPRFETEMPRAYDIKSLKKPSISEFKWQDKAVSEIKVWQQNLSNKQKQYGFFAVNMASTGCGKTLGNAKVMRVLSPDGESLRYILALGLRTLTLQTGDEYRERIGLDKSDLVVLIGSQAVMDLHKQKDEKEKRQESDSCIEEESWAQEELMDGNVIDYEFSIPENELTTILTEDKHRKFLYVPVLACTIDHLMAATETKRGGRYILPSLRLMSSDLVIDEIDDFNGKDLIAIGRLIHLAGMLGCKVMISSATIPPDLAEGYFNIYHAGWQIFAKTREISSSIGCAWISEFDTQVKTIPTQDTKQVMAAYKENHNTFVKKHASRLKKESVKRKAEIVSCERIKKSEEKRDESIIEEMYFEQILEAIINKHRHHNVSDPKTQKKVSFGLVRIANIEPCIAAAKYLIEANWPEDVDIKIMTYHARQILLMRSEQEKHLDIVLKRKDSQAIFADLLIREHLSNSHAANVIFILVATPVEEVGRDHDFDWAVVEPSSFRSIIQLAGRVLRHRQQEITKPNIALMQYNLKALKNGDNKEAFIYPGYESKSCKLATHNLSCLIEKALLERIDALPRILCNNELKEKESLVDLEHFVMKASLTNYDKCGPETMQGWLTENWWLTALPQVLNRFREGEPQVKLYLLPDEDDRFVFMEKDEKGNFCAREDIYNIEQKTDEYLLSERLWLRRDYQNLLEKCAEQQNISLRKAAEKYGEISIRYGDSEHGKKYIYLPQFGLSKLPMRQ